MKIRLLSFASASDAVGARELDLELASGSDVGSLKSELEARFPALGELWHRLAVAVDGEIANDSTPLGDGVEVALLPPVSGGQAATTEPARAADRAAALTFEPLSVERLHRLVGASGRGAVLLFLGTVRDRHQGRRVERLIYSAYEPMALRRLERIVRELESEHQELRAAIHHRLGDVPVGEPSVIIAVASPHRAAAYAASRRALERLKSEVPIWKQECYADGETVWREEESLLEERPPSG